MRGGISRNLPWRCRKAPFGAGRPAGPAKAAGIAPRLEPEGDGEGLRPQPRPGRDPTKRLRPRKAGSGRVARPSGGAAIRKGISRGSRLERFLERRDGSGPPSKFASIGPMAQRLSKGRPEGLRPRCEPAETARLRPGLIQSGSGSGTSVLPMRPGRDRRGASRPVAETTGFRTGLTDSLRDSEESEAGVRARLAIQSRPARDGLATQRRQSKLGQVGAGGDTGPHSDSRPALLSASREEPPRGRRTGA